MSDNYLKRLESDDVVALGEAIYRRSFPEMHGADTNHLSDSIREAEDLVRRLKRKGFVIVKKRKRK